MLTEWCSLGLEIELIQKDFSFPLCLAHNISPAIQNSTVSDKDQNRKCGIQPSGLDEDWVRGLVMRKPKAHSQQAEHSWGAECLNSRALRANQPSCCCNSSLVISLHVDHMWLHFNMSYITLTITGIDSKVCVGLLSATVHK